MTSCADFITTRCAVWFTFTSIVNAEQLSALRIYSTTIPKWGLITSSTALLSTSIVNRAVFSRRVMGEFVITFVRSFSVAFCAMNACHALSHCSLVMFAV